ALENPEVGGGVRFDRDYTLEEVAEMHVEKIKSTFDGDITIAGYSMGGMILAIMATLFRSRLPRKLKLAFLMTAPRFPELPPSEAIREGTEEEWARALAPYFSPAFLREHPKRFGAYVRYRSFGLNGQSTTALFRQIIAMQRCDAAEYFARIDGAE